VSVTDLGRLVLRTGPQKNLYQCWTIETFSRGRILLPFSVLRPFEAFPGYSEICHAKHRAFSRRGALLGNRGSWFGRGPSPKKTAKVHRVVAADISIVDLGPFASRFEDCIVLWERLRRPWRVQGGRPRGRTLLLRGHHASQELLERDFSPRGTRRGALQEKCSLVLINGWGGEKRLASHGGGCGAAKFIPQGLRSR